MAIVVNMLGGPGRGKSTAAYTLIGRLKAEGYKAEIHTEFAKWPAYRKDKYEMADQLHLMVEHNHMLNIYNSLVDIVVTDTSLLNCVVYTNDLDVKLMALKLFRQYDNISFIVPRKKIYAKFGRSQSEEEAIKLDEQIFEYIKTIEPSDLYDLQNLTNTEEVNNQIYLQVTRKFNSRRMTNYD